MTDIDDIVLGGEHVVAFASSERPKDLRWSVLTIFRVPESADFEGRYIAEIVGETRVPGEQRRVRRKAFATMAEALSWDRWATGSALYKQLRQAVLKWFDDADCTEEEPTLPGRPRDPILLGTLSAGSGAKNTLAGAASALRESIDPANVRKAAQLLSESGHGLHAGLMLLMADEQDRAIQTWETANVRAR